MSQALVRHPRLISLEGGEGAGKTSAIAAIREVLQSHGHEVVLTREPGGTPLAERIRELLLRPHGETLAPETELLLMFASRAQLVCQVLQPALARGEWVLSDRFTDASYAYQGGGRGHDTRLIALLEREFVGIEPGLTLLLDVPVDVGLRRARDRGGMDRIESEQDAFFERVRGAYLERAREHPSRFVVIDAARPADEVRAAALDALRHYRARIA